MAPHIPKLRRQREPSRADRAFVQVDGQRIHLGIYGSEEANERYARVVAEVARGRSVTVADIFSEPDDGQVTVNELILGFWQYAEQYYRRPDGTPTGSLENFRYAFRPLRELYGSTGACSFGPKKLKLVRDRMIAAGGSRKYVNDNVGRIKRLFAWRSRRNSCPPASTRRSCVCAHSAEGRTV